MVPGVVEGRPFSRSGAPNYLVLPDAGGKSHLGKTHLGKTHVGKTHKGNIRLVPLDNNFAVKQSDSWKLSISWNTFQFKITHI